MKVKTSELTGAALDWAVRIARGDAVTLDEDRWICIDGIADMPLSAYNPSTDWAQGGPIIERERIWIQPEIGKDGSGNAWYAVSMRSTDAYGPTPLIAAMRCYVASKLGDEVEVPDELV